MFCVLNLSVALTVCIVVLRWTTQLLWFVTNNILVDDVNQNINYYCAADAAQIERSFITPLLFL